MKDGISKYQVFLLSAAILLWISPFMGDSASFITKAISIQIAFAQESEPIMNSMGKNLPFKEILDQAEKGNAEMQFLAGWGYQYGMPGIPIDYKKSAYWYEKGSGKGNAKADIMLGFLHYWGKGLEKDEGKEKSHRGHTYTFDYFRSSTICRSPSSRCLSFSDLLSSLPQERFTPDSDIPCDSSTCFPCPKLPQEYPFPCKDFAQVFVLSGIGQLIYQACRPEGPDLQDAPAGFYSQGNGQMGFPVPTLP